MNLIKWRRGCRDTLFEVVHRGMQSLPRFPAYEPGRGRGLNWPLRTLDTESAPMYFGAGSLPALLATYEEYVDRYLVSHDFDVPPRRWLHANVPADEGLLEYVFPLFTGPSAAYAVEILLVRLAWMIQQHPGSVCVDEPDGIVALTPVGKVGISRGVAHYRFREGGVRLLKPVSTSAALSGGHIRVFGRALNKLYEALDDEGKEALTLLVTRLRAKLLLRRLYGDSPVTISYLDKLRSINDKILSIEQLLMRSDCPADALRDVLVPEHLDAKEYRTLFDIPWNLQERCGVPAQRLIHKMPLVRQFLESR